jgi:hypothetical protein
MRRHHLAVLATLAVLTIPVTAWTLWHDTNPGRQMTDAASEWLASLTTEQREIALLAYDDESRVKWHFIPLEYRKGLQIRDMTPEQRELATALLRSSLSAMGYHKAERIMQFETLLNEFEAGAGRFLRDPERYYFTLFGEPSDDAKWGLRERASERIDPAVLRCQSSRRADYERLGHAVWRAHPGEGRIAGLHARQFAR